jgi:polysaccharide biosynthesis protein PslH
VIIAMRKLARLLALTLLLIVNTVLALISVALHGRRSEAHSHRQRAQTAQTSVLVVSPFGARSESGGAKAANDFIAALSTRFNVRTWLLPNAPAPSAWRNLLGSLLLRPLPMPGRCRPLALGDPSLKQALSGEDIVVFEFFASAVYLYLRGVRSRRVVIRDHEVLVRKLDMERRAASGLDAALAAVRLANCYVISLAVYAKADGIVTLTNEDRSGLIEWFPFCRSRTVAIAAPFEPPVVHSRPLSQAPVRDLLMVANFFHSPNVDGLVWFLKHCAPHLEPGFRLHLCGLDQPLSQLPLSAAPLEIVRHGFVEDSQSIAALGAIAVAPIVSGGGVRIKNLFLGALGIALVTTPLGNEGIDFVDNVHALVCSDGPSMAARINALSRDPEHVLRLGAGARSHIDLMFRHDAILDKLSAVIAGPLPALKEIQA